MSDRPTPETDAAAWVEYNPANALVFASFARKLERQRDEAREELINLRVENDHNWQATADLEEMIKLVRELRDALNNASRFVDCYTSENSAAIDDKWATARICNAVLAKAKEVLS